MKTQQEQNKANAIAFYQMAYEGQPTEAVQLYVGAEYIQHNPAVGDEEPRPYDDQRDANPKQDQRQRHELTGLFP